MLLKIKNNDSSAATNENTLEIQRWETNLTDSITKEVSTLVQTVEDNIQNAILTAIENSNLHRIELANRSENASFVQDVASVTANAERGEQKETLSWLSSGPEFAVVWLRKKLASG